jgi:hypothetical protein
MTTNIQEWAEAQWGPAELGDRRLTRRAVQVGTNMAQQAGAPLSQQMGRRSALIAAYRLLSNEEVSGLQLLAPHQRRTHQLAAQQEVTLLIQDRTTLDYSAHHHRTAGLGEISTVRERRGILLHSVLAVSAPAQQVLGLAHVEVIVRDPNRPAKQGRKRSRSAEGQAWEKAVQAIGRVPTGAQWVYISDRESDIYEYLTTCRTHQADFVVRAFHERVVKPVAPAHADSVSGETQHLLKIARQLPRRTEAEASYTVEVTTRTPNYTRQTRQANIELNWTEIELQPPFYARQAQPIRVRVIRVWEPQPPTGLEPVEWILLTSSPILAVADARQCVAWYTVRPMIEDFHMCLKTGCQVERSQLDHVNDLQRLLGFILPIAVRLLQLRQEVRILPDTEAQTVVEPIYVRLLIARLHLNQATLSLRDFWKRVAQLGGYQGRTSDGPPGWRTLWRGWTLLSQLVEGARLFQSTG